MNKWFKDILPDKDPYHNRGRDQMRKKGGGRNSSACGFYGYRTFEFNVNYCESTPQLLFSFGDFIINSINYIYFSQVVTKSISSFDLMKRGRVDSLRYLCGQSTLSFCFSYPINLFMIFFLFFFLLFVCSFKTRLRLEIIKLQIFRYP